MLRQPQQQHILYAPVLESVRTIMVTRMAKPEEVSVCMVCCSFSSMKNALCGAILAYAFTAHAYIQS